MEVIILVAALSLFISAWGLGYMFSSARNSIQRHETWHIQTQQDLQYKMDVLLKQEVILEKSIRKLKKG